MAGAEQHNLRKYLLGLLTEAEEEQIEIRLLSDSDFAEEFDIVVDEITDDYITGKFEGAELEQLEQYFFKSEARRDKLKFALALKTRKSELTDNRGRNQRPFQRYLAIAASVIVAVGAGSVVWRAFFYQSDLNKGLVALRSAFSTERPLEARLSDFTYAPLANQRGGPIKIDYLKRDLAASLLLKEVVDHPSARSHHALGQYYLAERKFDQAIDQFKAAVVLDPDNAKIHSDLGAALLEEGKNQSSEPNKGKALEILGRSLEHITKALELDSSLLEAHFNRALASQYMMPSEQAAVAWREYLRRDGSSLWAAEARRNLQLVEENYRRSFWNPGDAVNRFLDARLSGDDGAAWNVLAQNYTSAGNEVTNHLLDSLFELNPVSPSLEPGEALQALRYVGHLELQRNDDHHTSKLVRHYEQAPPKTRLMLANARRHMKTGYELFTKSKFRDAIGEYADAKLSYENAGDSAGTALVDYRLNHCHLLLNDPNKAESGFHHLSDVCKEKDYRWLLTQCLYGLAHASASENEVSRALEYSEQALARFEKLGDLNGILKCFSQLADLNQLLKRVERSLGYLSRGLSLAAEIRPEPMQMWGLLVQMAFSMRAMDLYKAALFYQMEALHVALAMGRPLIISRSYGYLGATYAMLKMYLEAVNEATKAFETGQNVSDDGGLEIMANASLQLGEIYRQAGDCNQATEAYSNSIQLYGTFGYYSYVAHKGKLLCYIAGSDYGAVREELKTVMDLSESYRKKITTESARISFFDIEQSVFDLAIQFEFVTMKDPVRAFNYSELSRARSLGDAMHQKTQVLTRGYGPDLHLPTVTNSLPLSELQKRMPAGAQVLQYAVLDDRLLMWIVTKAGIKHVEVGVGSRLLTQKVRDYLDVVNTPPTGEPGDYLARAEDLYRILVVPAEPFLDKAKFLCVVPDKILHYLPYGALVSPGTNKFLIEEYDVGTAPNSSIFANLSAAAKGKGAPMEEKLLSVGNPKFDKTAFDWIRDLPSAAREARAIARVYPNHRLLLPDDARESTIKSEIQNADVIHLAMHYVINENSAMLSGFPLTPERSATTNEDSNGFLQSFEIYGMDLQRARLVVLSACQTGIEQHQRGEGAIGAARPFLVSGVPTVVASLWPVDSDASAHLMTDFHRHRIRNKLSTTKALKQAQMEMARGNDMHYRHPYYWASFLAIGGQPPY